MPALHLHDRRVVLSNILINVRILFFLSSINWKINKCVHKTYFYVLFLNLRTCSKKI